MCERTCDYCVCSRKMVTTLSAVYTWNISTFVCIDGNVCVCVQVSADKMLKHMRASDVLLCYCGALRYGVNITINITTFFCIGLFRTVFIGSQIVRPSDRNSGDMGLYIFAQVLRIDPLLHLSTND